MSSGHSNSIRVIPFFLLLRHCVKIKKSQPPLRQEHRKRIKRKLEEGREGLGVQVRVKKSPSPIQGVDLIRMGQTEFYRLELINKILEQGVLFLE